MSRITSQTCSAEASTGISLRTVAILGSPGVGLYRGARYESSRRRHLEKIALTDGVRVRLDKYLSILINIYRTGNYLGGHHDNAATGIYSIPRLPRQPRGFEVAAASLW